MKKIIFNIFKYRYNFCTFRKENIGHPINYYLDKNEIIKSDYSINNELIFFFIKSTISNLEKKFSENNFIINFYKIWNHDFQNSESKKIFIDKMIKILAFNVFRINKFNSIFTLLLKFRENNIVLQKDLEEKLLKQAIKLLESGNYNFFDLGFVLVNFYQLVKTSDFSTKDEILNFLNNYLEINEKRICFRSYLFLLESFKNQTDFSNLDIKLIYCINKILHYNISYVDFRIIDLFIEICKNLILFLKNKTKETEIEISIIILMIQNYLDLSLQEIKYKIINRANKIKNNENVLKSYFSDISRITNLYSNIKCLNNNFDNSFQFQIKNLLKILQEKTVYDKKELNLFKEYKHHFEKNNDRELLDLIF